jgi:hypothetical protein
MITSMLLLTDQKIVTLADPLGGELVPTNELIGDDALKDWPHHFKIEKRLVDIENDQGSGATL